MADRIRIFVEFNQAESDLLRKLQKGLKEWGVDKSLKEIIRGAALTYAHDTMGQGAELDPESRYLLGLTPER